MSVSNKLIFEKMKKEIEFAKTNQHNVREHMVKVKLLCELMIDSNVGHDTVENIMTEQVGTDDMMTPKKEAKVDDPFSIFEF